MKTNNLKRFAGLMFILAMMATICVAGSLAVSAADPTPAPATPTDTIKPSTVTNLGALNINDFNINLVTEIMTVPSGYTVASFSIDGGTKWRDVKKAFTGTEGQAEFQKMLNRNMTLVLSDKSVDRASGSNKGKPETGGTQVRFPLINRRARANRLAVNYAIAYASTSEIYDTFDAAGRWTIVSGTTPVTGTSTEITVASADNPRVPDNKLWATLRASDFPASATNLPAIWGNVGFWDEEYAAGKIAWVFPVVPTLSDDGRQIRVNYFVRVPAAASGSSFTAASRFRRLTVRGVSKALNPSLKKGEIKLRKNTYWAIATPNSRDFASTPILSSGGGQLKWADLVKTGDVTGADATVVVWSAPTAKKPPSVPTTENRAGALTLASPTSTPSN